MQQEQEKEDIIDERYLDTSVFSNASNIANWAIARVDLTPSEIARLPAADLAASTGPPPRFPASLLGCCPWP